MDGAILTGWNTFGPFPSKLIGYVRILPHLRQGGGGAMRGGHIMLTRTRERGFMDGDRPTYYSYFTPAGPITVAANGRAITRIALGKAPLAGVCAPSELTNKAATQVQEYLAGKRTSFSLPLSALRHTVSTAGVGSGGRHSLRANRDGGRYRLPHRACRRASGSGRGGAGLPVRHRGAAA